MHKGLLIAGISTALLFGMPCCVCGASYEPELSDAASWHRQHEQDTPGTSEADWFSFAVQRAPSLQENPAPAALEAYVTEKYRTAQKLSPAKATEWHRISLTLRSMGVDPSACGPEGDINLIADGTYNRGNRAALDRQGMTGWIWALITLHSEDYTVPGDAHDTEADMIRQLLSRQLPEGGFALSGTGADVDVTASAVIALAPLYDSGTVYTYTRLTDGAVCTATIDRVVDDCIALLSDRQLESGGFASYGTENAESSAQVILALLSLGRDPRQDEAFQNGGSNPVDAMLAYRRQDGGFAHLLSQAGSNVIATNQCMLALAGLQRYDAGMGTVYDLRDVPLNREPGETTEPVPEPDSAQTEPAQLTTARPGTTTLEPAQTGAEEPLFSQETRPSVQTALATEAPPALDLSISCTVSAGTTEDDLPGAEHPELSCQWWILGLACIALGGCMLQEKGRKKPRQTGMGLTLIGAVLCLLPWVLDNIQTPEEYYGASSREDTGLHVTMSIDCSRVYDAWDQLEPALQQGDYFPADGWVLSPEQIAISEGDTVFDALQQVTRHHQIQLEYQRTGASDVYVQGISYLYEFSCGPRSGWIYLVNGKPAEQGCGAYLLSDGDIVEWRYIVSEAQWQEAGI